MPSFQRLFPYLLVPGIGLLIGWIMTSASGPASADADKSSLHEVAPSPRMRAARSSAPAMTRDELLAEAKRLVENPDKKSRRMTLDETIADWTDEEVIAALEKAAMEPDVLLRQDSMAGDLLRSFSKRDPDKAMRWALDQPLLVRRKFAGHVLSALLPERYAEALVLAKVHSDIFEGKVPTNVVRAAVTQSALQGADVFVARLKELMQDGSAPFMEFPKDVAKGFDFAAALDSPDFQPLASEKLKRSMLQAWMGEDKEAAYQWVLENNGPGHLARLRNSQWSHSELKGHVQWLAPKVEVMPEDQWRLVLISNSGSFLTNHAHAGLWLDSLSDPTIREAFRDVAAGSIFLGNRNTMEAGLKALDGLPDDQSRISRLEMMITNPPEHHRKIPMEPAAETLLRGTLGKWGADSQQAEDIISKMRSLTTSNSPNR